MEKFRKHHCWPKPTIGRIRTVRECDFVGGVGPIPVYPVTSTKAIFNEKNENLEDILNNGIKFQDSVWIKNLYTTKIAPYIADGDTAEGKSYITFNPDGNLDISLQNKTAITVFENDKELIYTKLTPDGVFIYNDEESSVITKIAATESEFNSIKIHGLTDDDHNIWCNRIAGISDEGKIGEVALGEDLKFDDDYNLIINWQKLPWQSLPLGTGLSFDNEGKLNCTVKVDNSENTTTECTCKIESILGKDEEGTELFKFNGKSVYGPYLGAISNIEPIGNSGSAIAKITYHNGNSLNLYVDNSVLGDYVSLYGKSRITAAESDDTTILPEIEFESNTSYSSVGDGKSYLENLTIDKTLSIDELDTNISNSNWYYNHSDNIQENEKKAGDYAIMAVALKANSNTKPVRLIKDSDLLSYTSQGEDDIKIGTLKLLGNSIDIFIPDTNSSSITVDSPTDYSKTYYLCSTDGLGLYENTNIEVDPENKTITATETSITAKAFYQTSDERLKENIKDIDVPLEVLLRIPTVNFNFKDKDKLEMGTIAQEVEKICPEIINTDGYGYKSVDYSKLSILALKGLKDLAKRVNELEKLIDKLV